MSDDATPSAASPTAADPSPAASAVPAPDAAGDDPFGELPNEPLFPRSYVEKLRTEGSKYRTEAHAANERYAEYDKVYGAYEPEDRQVWMDLARTWASDPNRAAEAMQAIAAQVLGNTTNGSEPEAVDEPEDTGAAYDNLNPEQVQQMIEEALSTREASAAERKAIDDIFDKVRGHGFDPESREGIMLLWTANNETDGDIDAAVEKIKGYRQGIIDEYVAGRSGQHSVPAPNGGVAANQQVEITDWDDARKGAESFLRGQRGAGA